MALEKACAFFLGTIWKKTLQNILKFVTKNSMSGYFLEKLLYLILLSLSKKTCEVNRMGENSSCILTCYAKTVTVSDFETCLGSSTSVCQRIFQNDSPTRAK